VPNWRWNAPISEGFREITATNADPDGLVARRLGDLLAELKVSRLAVERQGRMLQLRGVQFETRDIAPPALLLGELQHPSGDAGTARSRIDIHAPQLHRLAFGTFQTKGSDDQVAAVRHPGTAFLNAVIDFDPIDLLGQRTRDVGLEKRREGPAPTAG